MRLWHYRLIPYLPKSQLLGQWRELNSIFKKQDKHILINYIYEYGKDDLYYYSLRVIQEMKERSYKIKSFDNFLKYFEIPKRLEVFFKDGFFAEIDTPFFKHHNDRYLWQCFYNLQEKYDRGQKDFSKAEYERLENFIIFHFK